MGAQKPNNYRYPGLRYFTREDTGIFWGRKQDADKLFNLTMIKQILVLHAESGTGKSSLIEAGLLPKIYEDKKYLPVVVRLDRHPEQLLADAYRDIRTELGDGPQIQLPMLEDVPENLWVLAKKLALKTGSRTGKKLLLIFDQFEEFQIYSHELRADFKDDLRELLGINIPARFYELLVKQIGETLKEKDISDQQRSHLNDDLQFLKDPLDVRVIFAVREDKLGTMTLLADQFPDILKNDMILLPLTRRDAIEAIIMPAQVEGSFDSPKFEFDNEDTVLSIIAQIQDGETKRVDPLQIQIVCSNLEKKIIDEMNALQRTRHKLLNRSFVRKITKNDVPEIDDIIKDFYQDVWKKVNDVVLGKYINTSAQELDDIRKNITGELIAGNHRAMVLEGRFDHLDKEKYRLSLATMVKEGFLREIPYNKDKYIQLYHDRFVRPVYEDMLDIQSAENMESERSKLATEYAKRRASDKKMWLTVFTVFVIVIVGLIGYLWFVQQQKQAGKRQKMIDIAKSSGRSNPQLSFLIAREWLQKYPSDNDFDTLAKRYDLASHASRTGIFYEPSGLSDIMLKGDTVQLSGSSGLTTWSISGRTLLHRQSIDSGAFLKRFSLNGQYYFLVRHNKNIEILNQHQTVVESFRSAPPPAVVQISPNGRRLIIGNKVFDVLSKQLLGVVPLFPFNRTAASCVAFFNDGNDFAAGYGNGYKIIYRIEPQKTIRIVEILPPSKSAAINSLAIGHSDQIVATGDNNNTIEVWHIRKLNTGGQNTSTNVADLLTKSGTLNPPMLLKWHTDAVTSISISPDGRYLLSGSRDRLAILWDIKAGKKVDVLKGINLPVVFTAFSADGIQMATATDKGDIFLWSIERPSRLYAKGKLNYLCPFDYYNAGLNSNDPLIERFYQSADVLNSYRNLFDYIINLPKSNLYPNDEDYTSNLRKSFKDIDSLYHKLKISSNYKSQLTMLQQNTIEQLYERLKRKQRDLLYEPVGEDPEAQHHEAGAELKINIKMLIENTDLTDINMAVSYTEKLISLARYFRDTLEIPDYATSVSYLKTGQKLIKTFQQKHENDPDLDYTYTSLSFQRAITYLYQKKPDSVELEISKIDTANTGDGLPNMVRILKYVCKNKPGPARTLFLKNERKVIWGSDYTMEPLKSRLIATMNRLKSRGITAPATKSFLVYLQARGTPTHLTSPQHYGKSKSNIKNKKPKASDHHHR